MIHVVRVDLSGVNLGQMGVEVVRQIAATACATATCATEQLFIALHESVVCYFIVI